jgi:MoxR-like ATPase
MFFVSPKKVCDGYMKVSLNKLSKGFEQNGYIIDQEKITAIYLSLNLDKPLLVCGPQGTGKTTLAVVLSKILNARLIRLQCHEGLDESKVLYDWNIQRQLINIHLSRQNDLPEGQLFSIENLLQRPLLQAILSKEQVVLLIDEIDRSEPDFEPFLLEILSDFQITIPEIGTIAALNKPAVIITNNGDRELSDALLRRCSFLYLDYPNIEQEASIVRSKAPQVLENLSEDIALAAVKTSNARHCSDSDLDWARVLMLLDADRYQKGFLEKTMELLGKKKM